MKVVYRIKGNPVKATEQELGQDEVNRLKARLEKAAKCPAWDRPNSMTGPPRSYVLGQQKRACEANPRREKTKSDERECRQSLAGSEKKLGPLHPETLALLQNLAGLLKSQGKITEADHNMRLLHMRRRMRESGTPRRKAQLNETYGTGANPSMLMRNVPAKKVPPRAKAGYVGSSTDTVPASVAPETPKPPSTPRPQSAPTKRRPPPPLSNFGVPDTRKIGMRPLSAKPKSSPGNSGRSVVDAPSTGPHGGPQQQARNAPAKKAAAPPSSRDPYQEIRAHLVEQMAESCNDTHRDMQVHGESRIESERRNESRMASLLREAKACAFQMSEELHLDPVRCSEAIEKLGSDLGLAGWKHTETSSPVSSKPATS